jgi:hypothetical protein
VGEGFFFVLGKKFRFNLLSSGFADERNCNDYPFFFFLDLVTVLEDGASSAVSASSTDTASTRERSSRYR